jgi:hypothetical protein
LQWRQNLSAHPHNTKKRGGGKCHSPALLHGKMRPKGHNNVDWRTGGGLKEEGDENNEQFSNTEIQSGDVVSWY